MKSNTNNNSKAIKCSIDLENIKKQLQFSKPTNYKSSRKALVKLEKSFNSISSQLDTFKKQHFQSILKPANKTPAKTERKISRNLGSYLMKHSPIVEFVETCSQWKHDDSVDHHQSVNMLKTMLRATPKKHKSSKAGNISERKKDMSYSDKVIDGLIKENTQLKEKLTILENKNSTLQTDLENCKVILLLETIRIATGKE